MQKNTKIEQKNTQKTHFLLFARVFYTCKLDIK